MRALVVFVNYLLSEVTTGRFQSTAAFYVNGTIFELPLGYCSGNSEVTTMAKSPEQILANYQQHAERSKQGFDTARTTSNPDLALSNIGQGLNAYLMQGLIGWRCGTRSPVSAFREGLIFVQQGYSAWRTMNGSSAAKSLHLTLEKSSFLAFLLNENTIAHDLNDLGADRLLDAILGYCLKNQPHEEMWVAGLDQLQKLKGSSLAVETYTTYLSLLRSPDCCDVKKTVERAISLFDKRKSNGFYSGGEQTDGGGNYNTITVDYRLAAIMKKIGYKIDSVHTWNWE